MSPTARVLKGIVDGKAVWLVDTPLATGPDAEMPGAVEKALECKVREQMTVHGVICLHDITDTNVKHTAERNLETAKMLLGPTLGDNVAVATTFWDTLPSDDQRPCAAETELTAIYSLALPAVTVCRLDGSPDGDKGAVFLALVKDLVCRAKCALADQEAAAEPRNTQSVLCETGSSQAHQGGMAVQFLMDIIAGRDKELEGMRALLQTCIDVHARETQQAAVERRDLLDELEKQRVDYGARISKLQDVCKTEGRARRYRLGGLDAEPSGGVSIPIRVRRRPTVARRAMADFGATSLHYAAGEGKTDLVRQLIVTGVPLEATMWGLDGSTDRSGGTALHWAALGGHGDAVAALLDADAQMEALNSWNRTPLHCAARNGHLAVVKLLVSRGANMEARRDTWETPLHFAVEEDHRAVVEFLLDSGADINAQGHRGTPLQFAITLGRDEIASLLAARGGTT